ncbi:TlpA family protein disulfide reductase [Chitinophaga lutea]
MKRWLLLLMLSLSLQSPAQQVRRIDLAGLEAALQHPDTALVVNFWATWCGPCIREIPWFEKQAKAWKNKPVKFIFISLDLEDAYPGAIQQFIRKHRMQSAVLWLDESNANKYARFLDPRWEGSIPATLFIHDKRRYRQFVEGELSEKELQQALHAMLD